MWETFWLATLSAHTDDGLILRTDWATWCWRQSELLLLSLVLLSVYLWGNCQRSLCSGNRNIRLITVPLIAKSTKSIIHLHVHRNIWSVQRKSFNVCFVIQTAGSYLFCSLNIWNGLVLKFELQGEPLIHWRSSSAVKENTSWNSSFIHCKKSKLEDNIWSVKTDTSYIRSIPVILK